jgi:hypothetical protein
VFWTIFQSHIRVLQFFLAQVNPENPRILSRQSTAKWRSAADADFSPKKLFARRATIKECFITPMMNEFLGIGVSCGQLLGAEIGVGIVTPRAEGERVV